jgi:rhamnogalacturonyl hydrolase YesR
MATSFLSKSQPLDRHYASAVLWEGIQKAGTAASNTSLLNSVRNAISRLVSTNGTLIGWDPNYYSLDDIRVGNNLLWAYADAERKEDKERYKTAASRLREQLTRYPRTLSGGFWHRNPQYKNQMWLDGLYMAEPFYATYVSLFEADNRTAWEDIALQFDLVEQHCRNATSGLLVHGYDELKQAVWADPVTGASPHVWDRAVGWYFMALVEVLQVYPKTALGYTRLHTYLTTLAAAVEKAQDPKSGGWWLVMDEPYPGMKGNYIESSAMAMFTYAYFKGVRTGLLEARYGGVAKKAWDGMVDKFVTVEKNQTLSWEGTVQVGSLNTDGSYEYYISVPVVRNDPKGAGPFIFAATEVEFLKKPSTAT